MYNKISLYFCLILMIILFNCKLIVYAKPITTKEQMQQNTVIMNYFDNDTDAAFCYYFKQMVNDGKMQKVEEIPVIQRHNINISKENYEAIFKHRKSATISKEEKNVSIMLCDSICAYYGISMDELGKIRQSKHLVNKKKKEVNNLFNDCLEMINEKFVKPKEAFDENRLTDIIAEKLIQKQNGQSVSTAPDCPSLI